MDIITHFLVPYIILTLIRSKNKLAGAFGGISLDFDFLIIWIGILFPQYFVFTHRGIIHSFVFAFFISLIFLFVISRKQVKEFIGKIIRRDINVKFTKTAIIAACSGAVIHLILDFLTSKGIPLFYPLSITRFSAELYYYIDIPTFILGAIVLFIIYLRPNSAYKKAAMVIFMIVLISFGGIRAYEKTSALEAESLILNGNYTQITAYPTSDMFTWMLVESDSTNSMYYVFQYNTLESRKFDSRTINCLTISGSSYQSAQNAINTANNLPEVQRFKWNAYYTCIDAVQTSNSWEIIYFDFLGSSWTRNNLTVYIP